MISRCSDLGASLHAVAGLAEVRDRLASWLTESSGDNNSRNKSCQRWRIAVTIGGRSLSAEGLTEIKDVVDQNACATA